ncbi:FAD:protein FMN transferase [Actinopolymorpha sp. NPDC004070]|uniref:FAD:protein FMN transferase n=1 Tax=Actinopolymorpha sp. NPDC004070 TaxID=3154548 RepID=UPI0033BEF0E5
MSAATAGSVRGPIRHVEYVMGTAVTIDVRDPRVGAGAVDAVVSWLHTVDATFSTYRPDSAISRLDRGEVGLADCPDTVRSVLERCEELRVETVGYFDPRYAGRLDPSGLVKGWSIEQADQILQAAGSRAHCLNAGGDVLARGRPAPGRWWRVGIADPHDRSRLATVVEGADIAVATSGTAERGAHVVDPRTGEPATGWASVTVVGPDLPTADAYATAALAMGDQAREWLAGRTGFEAYAIAPDGTTWATPGFPR